MIKSPGLLAALALLAGPLLGLACGYLVAPYGLVVVGGLAAAGACLWLMRAPLMQSASDNRMTTYFLLAAAYGFVAIISVSLASLGYYFGWRLHP